MKIAGVDPKSLCNEVLLVLPRVEQPLVFKARGLKSYDEFEALCPQPKPPGKQTRDGWIPDEKDPTYQTIMGEWSKKRLAHIVVKSLAPSEIEWDTVNEADPRTWTNWEQDLLNSNLSQVEVNRVLGLVLEANALDDAKLAKARESFLAGRPLPVPESCGLPVGQPSTQSGAPVSV